MHEHTHMCTFTNTHTHTHTHASRTHACIYIRTVIYKFHLQQNVSFSFLRFCRISSGRSRQRGWRCIIGCTFLRMVRWCIWLTRLTLVCEVIRYRLVQVRQNLKHKNDFSGWRPAIAFLYPFLFHSLLCLTSFLSQYKRIRFFFNFCHYRSAKMTILPRKLREAQNNVEICMGFFFQTKNLFSVIEHP